MSKFKVGDVVIALNDDFLGLKGTLVFIGDPEDGDDDLTHLVEFYPHRGGHDGGGYNNAPRTKSGWYYNEGFLKLDGQSVVDRLLEKYS